MIMRFDDYFDEIISWIDRMELSEDFDEYEFYSHQLSKGDYIDGFKDEIDLRKIECQKDCSSYLEWKEGNHIYVGIISLKTRELKFIDITNIAIDALHNIHLRLTGEL